MISPLAVVKEKKSLASHDIVAQLFMFADAKLWSQILSDLLRFSQTKKTFGWEKAGKGGKKREIVEMELLGSTPGRGLPRTPFLAATPATPLQPA